MIILLGYCLQSNNGGVAVESLECYMGGGIHEDLCYTFWLIGRLTMFSLNLFFYLLFRQGLFRWLIHISY